MLNEKTQKKDNTAPAEATVSVIIPTLNAAKTLKELLSAIMNQDYPIEDILVVDSSSDDETMQICCRYEGVRVISIPKEEFDHGRTRDMALRQSKSDLIVFLTQDAVPADETFIRKLIAPLSDCSIAVSVGRQLPNQDATRTEALVRNFNYPPVSRIRSAEDIPRLGIKAFFSSDSCAAYRRDVYLQLGGFDYPVKSNEDMFFAARALRNGYRVAYTADASVYHSHNFSLRAQYARNYLQGYEIERHRTLLGEVSLNSEGMQLVKTVSKVLLKEKKVGAVLCFGLDCAARWLGNRNGKRAYRREAKTNV